MEHYWHLPSPDQTPNIPAPAPEAGTQRPLLGRLFLVPNQEIIQEQYQGPHQTCS